MHSEEKEVKGRMGSIAHRPNYTKLCGLWWNIWILSDMREY